MARFQRGQSGNVHGRPRGAINKSTQLFNAMATGDAVGIMRTALRKAKAGDLKACDILLQRLWPVRKGAPIRFNLPPLERAGDLPKALTAITVACSHGILTTSEAADLATLMSATARAYEVQEIERRLAELERRVKNDARDHQQVGSARRPD